MWRSAATFSMREKFWELPLDKLEQEEWEALCDRCGKCCLIKLEDEDDGTIAFTRLVCRLFDDKKCQCSNYPKRFDHVSDCLTLNMKTIPDAEYWLPKTCAYVLRYHQKPLPHWHYLLAGNFETMHKSGNSVRHKTVNEDVIDDVEDAIEYIDWELGP